MTLGNFIELAKSTGVFDREMKHEMKKVRIGSQGAVN